MNKPWLGTILLAALLCLPPVVAAPITQSTPGETPVIIPLQGQTTHQPATAPEIHITKPLAGHVYLFGLTPFKGRLQTTAIVIGRRLTVETASIGVDHTKFTATRKVTGWNTTEWDYNTLDGTGTSLPVTTGIYTLKATGYDATDTEVAYDAVKVFYIKIGRDDFGVWANTKFDNGQTISTPLNIGFTEFASMLQSGAETTYAVPLQHAQDTTLHLRFSRTTLLNNTVNVIEINCNLSTTADTTKAYEISLEVRFPFGLLSGTPVPQNNTPYFTSSVGYQSTTGEHPGLNHVNTTFFFGHENISEPRIFRLRLQPDSVDERSSVTYFTRYQTFDANGTEKFYREFSVAFTPATDLTITTIPREAKVSYDFGRSAGVPTTIAFRAQGGILDDIIQTFRVNPLPQYMNFDLTILGSREFVYESDRSYDVSYSLDSEQNGNLFTIEARSLPTRIHLGWGIDLDALSNHSFSSFFEVNMSDETGGLAVTQADLPAPLVNISHFPRLFRLDSLIDLQSGTGNVTVHRRFDEPRNVTVTLNYEGFTITKSVLLASAYVSLAWDINLAAGTGTISVTRDTDAVLQYHTEVSYQGWTFTHEMTLSNPHVSLSWEVNREKRQGHLVFARTAEGGNPIFTTSITHDTWELHNTLELKNNLTDLYWDLSTADDPHAIINLTTGGGPLLEDTLAVSEYGNDILALTIGVETSDHFCLSWDNNNGQIENFHWSGRLLRLSSLSAAIDLPGTLLNIQASWTLGGGGSIDLQLNQPVTVNFIDLQTPRFQVLGYVSFAATRHLALRWNFSSTGFFRVDTFNQALGDEAAFKVFFDPDNQGNYQYGLNVSTTNFLKANFNVTWNTNYIIPRVWIAGTLPTNWWTNWDAAIMLNQVWYSRNNWEYDTGE
jgi:hypothetical protein